MDPTMRLIHRLAAERAQLWSKAGRQTLTEQEYWRLQRITRELGEAWDRYRRELATGGAEVADGEHAVLVDLERMAS